MRAKDIMTPTVITVHEQTSIEDVARILLGWRISAAPVVDDHDQLVGMVSEGDLIRHENAGTSPAPSWWLTHLADPDTQRDYAKSHGRVARDVMTHTVVCIDTETPLPEVAKLLEEHQIKRVPVMQGHSLVGIVSRANLLHGLAASASNASSAEATNDQQMRANILNHLHNEVDLHLASINITVTNSEADIWGTTVSEDQKSVIKTSVEQTAGISRVRDHSKVLPEMFRNWLSDIKR